MNKESTLEKDRKWIRIALVTVFVIWALRQCHNQHEQGVIENKGIGMLEAKGLYDTHPKAAKDYYMMVSSGDHTAAELSEFLDGLRIWRVGYRELSKRGLSDSEIMAIPYYELISATETNEESELKKLIRKYN
jgi:hypothetical protein